MLFSLFVLVAVYLITTLFGYVMHWMLHQEWAGQFNRSHMWHHQKLYPPEDFTSDKYRSAGKDSTLIFFTFASIPLILGMISLGLLGILSVKLTIFCLIEMGTIGFLNDYLHTAYHLNNHFLSRMFGVRWIFNKWYQIHYLHHKQMNKNLGIFWFGWDKLFRSFINGKNMTD